MSRRVTLPGADELFRATGSGHGEVAAVDLVPPRQLDQRAGDAQTAPADDAAATAASRHEAAAPRPRGGVRQTQRPRPRGAVDRRPSGRERHDEKITVYLSPDELGTFDFVFLGSLLLHLRDPVAALDALRTVVGSEAVIADAVDWLPSMVRRLPTG